LPVDTRSLILFEPAVDVAQKKFEMLQIIPVAECAIMMLRNSLLIIRMHSV
jgi:hypothetical protein